MVSSHVLRCGFRFSVVHMNFGSQSSRRTPSNKEKQLNSTPRTWNTISSSDISEFIQNINRYNKFPTLAAEHQSKHVNNKTAMIPNAVASVACCVDHPHSCANKTLGWKGNVTWVICSCNGMKRQKRSCYWNLRSISALITYARNLRFTSLRQNTSRGNCWSDICMISSNLLAF